MEYTGMVVLNGCPSLVRATEALVNRFNGGHYQRAVAEITIYEIEFTAGSDRSLDLNLLRTTANSLGLSIAPATSAGSGGLRFDVHREGDRLLGSRATLNWLQQQGQTSTRLHRRVYPIQTKTRDTNNLTT